MTYIRFPSERTPPSQAGFVVLLLAVIFLLVGMALLGVGVWARHDDDAFAHTAFMVGGGSFALGVLILLAWRMVRKFIS
jgi:hypothetical protein